MLVVSLCRSAGLPVCRSAALPVARKRLPVATPVAQEDSSGVSAFFGTWPDQESEEELLEALQAIE